MLGMLAMNVVVVENIIFGLSLIAGLGSWLALARSMRLNGRSIAWRHVAGIATAPFAACGLFMLLYLYLIDSTTEISMLVILTLACFGVCSPSWIPLYISGKTAYSCGKGEPRLSKKNPDDPWT
ncbi:hypothetical protein [Salinicola avicenniae]|uniref:hypothetical protein n=1 Tax=Salinicola avicenniae TaxID=2916836 RepID=UPI0020741D84|nr:MULTISPECIES: hypothetical protein [unclassified Salinicola]